jgi:hypothetical protein
MPPRCRAYVRAAATARAHTAPKKISLTKPLNVNHELPLEECEDDSDARDVLPDADTKTDDVATDMILRERGVTMLEKFV